jgi:hypothetical protein
MRAIGRAAIARIQRSIDFHSSLVLNIAMVLVILAVVLLITGDNAITGFPNLLIYNRVIDSKQYPAE